MDDDIDVSTDYLTCKELVELVTEYLDDGLTQDDRARFEEHMMTCPPCRSHIDQMRSTIRVLGRVPEEALSPDAEQSLLDAFRGWNRA